MNNPEQPQPLLITRQTNDRRGCRLLPVRKEVKQAWLNAAYAGIELLRETGTRDDLAILKELYKEEGVLSSERVYWDDYGAMRTREVYTTIKFPNVPWLRVPRNLNGERNYGDLYNYDLDEGTHRVFRETIEVLEKRFPDTDVPQQ